MSFIKNNIKFIIGFIIGGILCCCMTVYATTYLASDIKYTADKMIDAALDELYTRVPSGSKTITSNGDYDVSNKESVSVNVPIPSGYYKLAGLSNAATASDILNGKKAYDSSGNEITGTYQINYSTNKTYYMGNRKSGNSRSISLSKGTYIVSVTMSHSWASADKFNYNGALGSSSNSWIGVSNGTAQVLTGHYTEPTATDKTDTTKYVSQYTYSILYKVVMNSSGSITYITNDGDYSDCCQTAIIQTIKLD